MFRKDFPPTQQLIGGELGLKPLLATLNGLGVTEVTRFETQEENGLDLLFAAPAERIRLAQWTKDAPDFFQQLDVAFKQKQRPIAHPDLPVAPGWIVLLSYELAQGSEPHLQQPPADGCLPIAEAVYCAAVVLLNRATGVVSVLADTELIGQALAGAVEASAGRGHGPLLQEHSSVGAAHGRDLPPHLPDLITHWREDEPQRFLTAVERAKQYVLAGDIYQVNLSRRWQATVAADWPPHRLAVPVQAALAAANPAPFSATYFGEGWALVSASPERLLSVRDGVIETRPIAGTHPRGTEPISDAELAARLHAHPKERAEHVMLVDLERNDIGKLCLPGTVEVDELLTVEHHPTVHHLVSNVRGVLKPGTTPGMALRALFPGGTITGCPKLRAMQVIAELEGEGRGAYTGSLGYLTADGRMDFNILIRSLVLEPGRISFRAGAGIVADSIPQNELEETRAKARGLLRALT